MKHFEDASQPFKICPWKIYFSWNCINQVYRLAGPLLFYKNYILLQLSLIVSTIFFYKGLQTTNQPTTARLLELIWEFKCIYISVREAYHVHSLCHYFSFFLYDYVCKVLMWALSEGSAIFYAYKVLIPIETLYAEN